MSACEAELCPFWSGSGCDCSVFEISETDRRREQRAFGIRIHEDDEDDDFEELPAEAIGRCPICEQPILPTQPAVNSAFMDYEWQHAGCTDGDDA